MSEMQFMNNEQKLNSICDWLTSYGFKEGLPSSNMGDLSCRLRGSIKEVSTYLENDFSSNHFPWLFKDIINFDSTIHNSKIYSGLWHLQVLWMVNQNRENNLLDPKGGYDVLYERNGKEIEIECLLPTEGNTRGDAAEKHREFSDAIKSGEAMSIENFDKIFSEQIAYAISQKGKKGKCREADLKVLAVDEWRAMGGFNNHDEEITPEERRKYERLILKDNRFDIILWGFTGPKNYFRGFDEIEFTLFSETDSNLEEIGLLGNV